MLYSRSRLLLLCNSQVEAKGTYRTGAIKRCRNIRDEVKAGWTKHVTSSLLYIRTYYTLPYLCPRQTRELKSLLTYLPPTLRYLVNSTYLQVRYLIYERELTCPTGVPISILGTLRYAYLRYQVGSTFQVTYYRGKAVVYSVTSV